MAGKCDSDPQCNGHKLILWISSNRNHNWEYEYYIEDVDNHKICNMVLRLQYIMRNFCDQEIHPTWQVDDNMGKDEEHGA